MFGFELGDGSATVFNPCGVLTGLGDPLGDTHASLGCFRAYVLFGVGW